MINELEDIDSTNDEIEYIDSTNDEDEVEEVEEDKVEYSEREKQLYSRLKKAEAELKSKSRTEVQSNSNLSSSDLLAVMRANVNEDDMERVERFAKSEGQSIKEALKNPELKAILNLREEQRGTAMAKNVTNTRRGATKLSDSAIVANAQAGKLPDDDAGIDALIAAARKKK